MGPQKQPWNKALSVIYLETIQENTEAVKGCYQTLAVSDCTGILLGILGDNAGPTPQSCPTEGQESKVGSKWLRAAAQGSGGEMTCARSPCLSCELYEHNGS